MIPQLNDDLQSDFEIEEQPTKTYKMDLETMRIIGSVDGLDAMRQAVFKILNTERYNYMIYSWNYGVEMTDLIGQDKGVAYPEIKRNITEALLQDDRITSVDSFEFTSEREKVNVTFTVHTIEGDIEIGKVVNG